MPRYLLRGRDTPTGLQGAVNEGFGSRDAYLRRVAELMQSHVEAVYWSFDQDHCYIVTAVPNAATAAGAGTFAVRVPSAHGDGPPPAPHRGR